MKTLLLVALILTVPGIVLAAPFVVSNDYLTSGVVPDRFRVTLDSGSEVLSSPWTGSDGNGVAHVNTLHFDVGTVSVGTHTVSAKACKTGDPLWGPAEVCSVATPFSFPRPSAPVAPLAPTGGTLVP